jgi:hypothetical protein
VTPEVVGTLGHDAHGRPTDLGAIRRTDALVDLLATRRLRRPRALGDPVVTLLHSLTSDVDGRARHTGRRGGAHRRPGEPWVQAVAAALAFAAAAAAAAGLLMVSMLTRLRSRGF